jgi:DNA-binding transcriptional LysR family regulator
MRPDHPLASRASLTFTECADHPVVMLYDRWLIDLIMATEFAGSGSRLVPRIVSNSIDFMRQVIDRGLGIGFFTPIGFIDEIERGELVHVALAEPLLADSAIAILTPRGREPTLPARVTLDLVRRRLADLGQRLAAVARPSNRDGSASR